MKNGISGADCNRRKEAVSQMQKELPQLILLDIMMPDMSGYQFCELLKENPDTKDIPVIFVSAASELDDKMKGFQVGRLILSVNRLTMAKWQCGLIHI